MKKSFILGYTVDNLDSLIEFKNKVDADYMCEEWCEVFADDLETAKLKYEESFDNWKKSEQIKFGG